jgi:hypothetical protein
MDDFKLFITFNVNLKIISIMWVSDPIYSIKILYMTNLIDYSYYYFVEHAHFDNFTKLYSWKQTNSPKYMEFL